VTPAEELTLAAERLEALGAAATPGPWSLERRLGQVPSAIVHAPAGAVRHESEFIVTENMLGRDAAFIAAMRGVAKPLAVWLRFTVEDSADHARNVEALTLAREVIRATGGPSLDTTSTSG
jgi:hypothetical protein